MNQIKLDVTFTISVSDKLLSSLTDAESVTEFVINNCFKNNARTVHQIKFGDMYKLSFKNYNYKENK